MDKQHFLDQLFAEAKQTPVMQSFEQTKERFVSSMNNPAVKHSNIKQTFTKKWIIMLTTVSTLGISLFILCNNGKVHHTSQLAESTSPQIIQQQPSVLPVRQNTDSLHEQTAPGKPTLFISAMQELITEFPQASMSPETKETVISDVQPYNSRISSFKVLDDLPYQFPRLTEEEISITKKKKKAMLKALAKHDKNAYAYIPSGSFDYYGKQVAVQAFYISTTEVTNLEYRTFLFDLLIQERKEEFLKAKPDQGQWNKVFESGNKAAENAGKGFQEHYFSNKTFNEYPVVNISREGAELYCKWLSEELRKYVGNEKEGKYNDVRLPVRAEWVKAASNEGKQLPFPWGGPFTRNSKGSILANYRRIDEEATLSTQGTSGMDVTAPSKSYWPTELGLYNMSGNVAEMVYEDIHKNAPGTAGGSWKNTQEEIKIYAPDPYPGVVEGKPMIGFRVVSTYLIQNR